MHILSADGGIKAGAIGTGMYTISNRGTSKETPLFATVGRSVNQLFMGGQQRRVIYDTLVKDTGGFIRGGDLSSLYAPCDGVYSVMVSMTIMSHTVPYWGFLHANGRHTQYVAAYSFPVFSPHWTGFLPEGQSISVWFYHELSISLEISYGVSACYFTMAKVG